MLKNIQAVIFDLDGTLVDSMWIWEQIDIDYLKGLGYEMPDNLRNEICHLSFEQTAHYFKNKFNISNTIEEIMDVWHNMAYNHYANNVNLKPGAREFISTLKRGGIKIALATSNSIPLLEVCLKNNGIYDLFDVITTTDEVSRGKNYPDIYLLTAKKLGISPENCMVFEDILPAVQGATAAGMKVVAVYDESSVKDKEQVKLLASHYIETYLDII